MDFFGVSRSEKIAHGVLGNQQGLKPSCPGVQFVRLDALLYVDSGQDQHCSADYSLYFTGTS